MKDDPFVILVSWGGGVTCTENRQFDTDKIKSESFRAAALICLLSLWSYLEGS